MLFTEEQFGKPSLIYVKNFVGNDVNFTLQEMCKSHSNNTELNDTDNLFLPQDFSDGQCREDEGNERMKYQSLIKNNIEYDALVSRYPYSADTLNEILSILVDTVCTKKPYIRIAGDDKPTDVVRSQFLRLNGEHIGFCIDCLNENTTRVKNVKQYLLAVLYNAPLTMSTYYGLQVRHDMAGMGG